MDLSKLRKLLSYGSQKAPALLDDVVEEAGPVTNRVATEAVEVSPEVIGKASPRIKPDIEIPEGELVTPKVSTLDAVKEFGKKNKGKIIGGLTLAEMARQMLGQDDVPVMLTQPKEKAADKPNADDKIEEAAATAKTSSIKEMSDTDKARAGMDKFMANIPEDPQSPVKKAGPDFVKMIEDAQALEKADLFDSKLLRGSEMLGAGLARITPEHGSSDLVRKDAALHGERAKAKIGGHKEQQGFDKSAQDITDEDALRDPNSKVSQETKSQLAKYGINVKTAMEAKQLNPQIFNLLMADRAQQNQKEIAGMNVEATRNKLSTTLDEKQRKFARDLRKEATTGVLGKQYATYSTGQRMHQGLTEFAKNPSGYKDYATLMGGLKTLQGDESVVREAEVRLGINATSAINKAMNYLNAAANGRQLQPSQRAEMIDTINILNEASRKQYMHSVAPILEQADAEGIPHSTILSGSLSGAKDEAESAPSQYSPKEEAGIESFAKAKGISREEAISKLKAGGRLK